MARSDWTGLAGVYQLMRHALVFCDFDYFVLPTVEYKCISGFDYFILQTASMNLSELCVCIGLMCCIRIVLGAAFELARFGNGSGGRGGGAG